MSKLIGANSSEKLVRFIRLIREQRVILDKDLAALYGVETRVLIQAMKRNIERFPRELLSNLNLKNSKL